MLSIFFYKKNFKLFKFSQQFRYQNYIGIKWYRCTPNKYSVSQIKQIVVLIINFGKGAFQNKGLHLCTKKKIT